MRKTRWLLAAVLSFVSIITNAADEIPVKQLKAFLSASKSITANFKQVLINEAGDPLQTSYGQFYLQRPGKFRWDYTKPFQQQIISTSGKVWFYDTDLTRIYFSNLKLNQPIKPELFEFKAPAGADVFAE